jgi:nicotinamidase-related amidase
MLVELNYPTPIPVELDPAQTLLLIVDMENESAHPKAPLYMGEPVERIIPRIAIRAQAGGVGIYSFQECHS